MKLLPHEKAFWKCFVTHAKKICAGLNCPVHNPSDHHMRTWKLHWRFDKGMVERICVHGVGHPDPDDRFADPIHGCCGCCTKPKNK